MEQTDIPSLSLLYIYIIFRCYFFQLIQLNIVEIHFFDLVCAVRKIKIYSVKSLQDLIQP